MGGADPTGNELTLHTDRPVRADHVTLVQPQDGPRDRVLTQVSVIVNGRAPMTVDLGPDSLTPAGQRVDFPATDVRSLDHAHRRHVDATLRSRRSPTRSASPRCVSTT